jgi:chromosome segregation protein
VLAAEVADETALRDMRSSFETELAELQSREAVLEVEIKADAPRIAQAQENWFRLSSTRERLHGTASLASERVRMLSPVEEEVLGRDPEELEREAQAVRAEVETLAAEVEAGRVRLTNATALRAETEGLLAEENRRIDDAVRSAADRRDGLTRLAGQVDAMKQRIETRAAEIDRLQAQIVEARARAEKAQSDFVALESQIAGLDAGERNLDQEHESAASALNSAENALSELQRAETAAERERVSLTARVDALELALSRQGGGAALLAANERVSGILGSVAALIHVQSGFEDAVATALGDAADAIAVSDVDAAIAAMDLLKLDDAGRAGLLIAEANDPGEDPVSRRLPDGAVMAADVVDAPAQLRSAIRTLLRGVVIVNDLKSAREIVLERPSAVAVTRDGDSIGRIAASGGSASAPSLLQVTAALDEARTKRDAAAHDVERLKFEQIAATQRVEEAQKVADQALSGLYESDAQMAAVAEQLGALGNAARSANAEADRLNAAVTSATAARESDETSLRELQSRLHAAETAPVEEDPDTTYRDVLKADVDAKRAEEMDVRLAVRTSEERQRASASQAETLERAARDERESRRRFAERRERRAREAAVAAAVLKGAEISITWIEAALQQASNERTEAEQTRNGRDVEVGEVRTRMRAVASELEKLVDSVHRDEVARAEQRLRIEALENKVMEDLGLDAETLIRDFGPDQLVPPTPPAPGDEVDPKAPEPQPYPYVREEQEKRLKQAERGLNLLGKVNPLALEEFAALEERHKFLNEQLDDLRKSKNDLMSIVKDVDERVQQVFAEAFADTSREFESIFSRLFPGGEGRLVLTDPDDLLNSGVEVEARPPGKKLKRLSLLSGGERSLTAVAFLVALFKARPSPFYVMDEVEAALDDVNLGRLIDVMKELQDNSQLIVITHQKRTMEIADALYGVTMRGDGVSAVISQRLSEAREAED